MKAYLLRICIALDAFIQAFFRFGFIGITISSRADSARENGHRWGCWLCGVLDWVDPWHCSNARLNDIKRAEQAIAELTRH